MKKWGVEVVTRPLIFARSDLSKIFGEFSKLPFGLSKISGRALILPNPEKFCQKRIGFVRNLSTVWNRPISDLTNLRGVLSRFDKFLTDLTNGLSVRSLFGFWGSRIWQM